MTSNKLGVVLLTCMEKEASGAWSMIYPDRTLEINKAVLASLTTTSTQQNFRSSQ